jgi:hypothetical protein
MKGFMGLIAVLVVVMAFVLTIPQGEVARESAEQATSDPNEVSVSTFTAAVNNVCHYTISWWNSDPSEEGDVPSGGVETCVGALVGEWCEEDVCTWPGPESGWAYSDGHEAAETAWVAVATMPGGPRYLGDRFINTFKEELRRQREALGIPGE